MKTLIGLISIFSLSQTYAASTLEKLNGQWALDCTQTQINGLQGHTLETYTFNASSYQFKRQWFKKAGCKDTAFKVESEEGTIKIGKENTNNGFNPEGTLEIDFTTSQKSEQGVIWVNEAGSKMRTARGFAESRNTLLGILQYSKRPQ